MIKNTSQRFWACIFGILVIWCPVPAEPISEIALEVNGDYSPAITPDSFHILGDRIKVDTSGDTELIKVDQVRYSESVWPAYRRKKDISNTINKRLCSEAARRSIGDHILKGEKIPEFALFNQKGELLLAKDFLGKTVVMTFIFSRCSTPSMCPSSLARMMHMRRKVYATGLKNVQFVLMSFDPEYDTPGVLYSYAKSHCINNEDFTLLTGEKPVIDALMKIFGVFIVPASGTLSHTSVAVIIDKKGILVHREAGFQWNVQDFVDRVRQIN